MSEQDTKNSEGSGASVVIVDKSASSRLKPYLPTELEEDAASDLHKRSKAPAVPAVGEELKDTADPAIRANLAQRESMDCEHTVSDKHMHVSKKKSSSSKRRGSSPEEITMASLDMKKDHTGSPPQPIPAQVETVVSEVSSLAAHEKAALELTEEKKADNDSITGEIIELRTEAVVKEHSEWSDDEEAGGLPRSESRASRVTRAVRQLFCCGVAYQAPSEENIPGRDFDAV